MSLRAALESRIFELAQIAIQESVLCGVLCIGVFIVVATSWLWPGFDPDSLFNLWAWTTPFRTVLYLNCLCPYAFQESAKAMVGQSLNDDCFDSIRVPLSLNAAV
uniref:Cation_ATPase_C domain-containing protein n=1 Tax=Panagrellus redivivus TaxID=6233 RepID=A0A7E4ZV91_PANRE